MSSQGEVEAVLTEILEDDTPFYTAWSNAEWLVEQLKERGYVIVKAP